MISIYLATPITHEDPYVIDQRYHRAKLINTRLLDQGYYVYCPIVSCWPPVKDMTRPQPSWNYWKLWDAKMIQLCDAYVILTLEGWQRSVGIKDETIFADMLGKPVIQINYYDDADEFVKELAKLAMLIGLPATALVK